jgi:hypothetical protein
VIALDQITVMYVGETERLKREAIDADKRPVWTGTKPLDGDSVLSNLRSFCEVDLGPPPPWPHGLEITIRLKYLRLDPLFKGVKS